METLFVAQGIFDRYISKLGVLNFNKQEICALSTISILLSAKLEQPISPSFSRMIGLLAEEERAIVTKQNLIDLEYKILTIFGYDFNFPGPVQSMERFLRILGYDLNLAVYQMSCQICKFSLNESKFLIYRPSMVAACSIILSINIYERDNSNNFFEECQQSKSQQLTMNTNIWNNQTVHHLTGYSIEDIKQCLIALTNFISMNLQPDRLQGFNIYEL